VKLFGKVLEYALLFYQIKIVIKQYKTDELVKSMRSFPERAGSRSSACIVHSSLGSRRPGGQMRSSSSSERLPPKNGKKFGK
jgi:hypothetical protein